MAPLQRGRTSNEGQQGVGEETAHTVEDETGPYSREQRSVATIANSKEASVINVSTQKDPTARDPLTSTGETGDAVGQVIG